MEEWLVGLLKNGGTGGIVAALGLYFFQRSGKLEAALEQANALRIKKLEEDQEELRERCDICEEQREELRLEILKLARGEAFDG